MAETNRSKIYLSIICSYLVVVVCVQIFIIYSVRAEISTLRRQQSEKRELRNDVNCCSLQLQSEKIVGNSSTVSVHEIWKRQARFGTCPPGCVRRKRRRLGFTGSRPVTAVNSPSHVENDRENDRKKPSDSEWATELDNAEEFERYGRTGLSGEGGQAGEPGAPGRPGLPGEAGLAGLPGSVGETGIRGNQGPSGFAGAPGRPGMPGSSGMPGSPGLAGAPGYAGSPGLAGMPGAPGRSGMPGSPGKAGMPGSPGRSGMPGGRGYMGGRGLQGPPGERGYSGSQGRPGSSGEPGLQGQPGESGLTGDSYTHQQEYNNQYVKSRGDQGIPIEDPTAYEVSTRKPKNDTQIPDFLRLLDHPECKDEVDHKALMEDLKTRGKVSFMILVDLDESVYCIVHA